VGPGHAHGRIDGRLAVADLDRPVDSGNEEGALPCYPAVPAMAALAAYVFIDESNGFLRVIHRTLRSCC
jgi:hypothetical protein